MQNVLFTMPSNRLYLDKFVNYLLELKGRYVIIILKNGIPNNCHLNDNTFQKHKRKCLKYLNY